MKKICFIIIIAVSSLFISNNTSAQTSDIVYFMRNVPGSYKMNPAMTPVAKFYLNFPVISAFNLDFGTSGFVYKDLINQHPQYADSLQLDLKGFYGKLTDNNFFKLATNFELFGFGFSVGKKNYVSLGIDLNFDTRINFSKDLIGVLVYGTDLSNAQVNILDGKLISMNAYLTPSIGYTRVVNDKLTVGLRAKMPFGLLNIETEKSSLSLDFNNGISAIGDFLIRTSNIYGKLQMSGLNDPTSPEIIENINVDEMLKNRGFAVDLGATYKLRKDMLVSFSIQDLGYIKWSTNTTNIQSKNPGGKFTIEPININGNGENDDSFEGIEDSIISKLDLEAVETESYTTMLPTKIYAGYTWNFAKTQFLNALYKASIGNNYFDNQLSLFYNCQLERYLNVSIGNTFMFGGKNSSSSMLNPSAALNLNLYMINIYFGGAVSSSYNVAEMSGVNFFFGTNLAFGYKNYWKRDDKTQPEQTPIPEIIEEPIPEPTPTPTEPIPTTPPTGK